LVIAPLPKPAQKGARVAFVNCTLPSCLPGGAAAPGAELGWEVQDFDFDLGKGPTDYVNAVERALQTKPDVMIIQAVYPEPLIKDQIAAAAKAGIKVVDVGGHKASDYVACIQCQPATEFTGAALAHVALADAGRKTSVGIVFDKTLAPVVSMSKGAQDAIAASGEGSTSHLVELNVADNPAANAARTVNFLQRNPDVEYLLYTTPGLMLGARPALDAAGLSDRVKSIGTNPSGPSEVGMLQTGEIFAWVGAESGGNAFVWRAMDAAARALQNAPIEPFEPLPSLRLITRENSDPELAAPTDFRSIYKRAWGISQ
jgi:ABC-type sugar transport system substrate-binding protein